MRVFCIGDSTTFGLGDGERLGWVERLPAIEDVQYYNLGVPGQTMSQVLERAYHEVTARLVPYHDSLIIVGGGLNDLCMDDKGNLRTPPDVLYAQVDALVGAMKKLAPTLVLSPFPVDEKFNPYFVDAIGKSMTFKNVLIEQATASYKEICEKHEVPFLDMYDLLRNDSSYQGALKHGDGIHPDEMGYVSASEYITNWKALRLKLPEPKQ